MYNNILKLKGGAGIPVRLMEELRKQQIEALQAVYEYNQRIIPALEEIVFELRGAQKEDTKDYLNHILKGVNWIIQVVNGTRDLINEKEEVINKEQMNDIIVDLNGVLKEENFIQAADIIEKGILPFVSNVTKAAKDITGIEMN